MPGGPAAAPCEALPEYPSGAVVRGSYPHVVAAGAVNAAYSGRSTAEMAGIDPAQMDASAAGGSYSFRYVLRPDECTKVLAERMFTDRQQEPGLDR